MRHHYILAVSDPEPAGTESGWNRVTIRIHHTHRSTRRLLEAVSFLLLAILHLAGAFADLGVDDTIWDFTFGMCWAFASVAAFYAWREGDGD